MIGGSRPDPAVLLGGDAGKLAKLPVEMRLIAVASIQSQPYPSGMVADTQSIKRSLEALDSAEHLGSEPDILTKQRNEAAVAVTGFSHDLAYVGHDFEPFEGVSYSRMKSSHNGQPQAGSTREHLIDGADLGLQTGARG